MTPNHTRTLLIGAYGVGMIGAGIFRADPAQGFPVGTPETTTTAAPVHV